MCGICASISLFIDIKAKYACANSVLQELDKLQRRGPDFLEKLTITYPDINSSYANLFFCSSVLHLRGPSITKQPVKDEFGHVLLWNGEIFGGPLVPPNCESDTRILSEKLFSASDVNDILEIISCVQGPYAFIFYQPSGYLWFGRDLFGRRSLLWNFSETELNLCSVIPSKKDVWEEVPANGVFCLDLNKSIAENFIFINNYQWSSSASGADKTSVCQSSVHNNKITMTQISSKLKIPVTHPLKRIVPLQEEILVVMDAMKTLEYSPQEYLHQILLLSNFSTIVDCFENVLSEAIERRVCNRPKICKKCFNVFDTNAVPESCGHSSLGILFSGGLDSIIIACLTDRYLLHDESIDLINVAFSKLENKEGKSYFDTPDRITGKNGVKSLRKICPKRKWNFVEVNVTEEDLLSNRKYHISDILYPCCTVLDDSIGCALWFAARGSGFVKSENGYEAYSSPARVLLLGMGADEQLGGYSRHRAKFMQGDWKSLIEEISLELDRIGTRNLGRDDRIIADHAVESRYPFLDEVVVSFLNNVPIWLKMNLNLPRGLGEKLLLRLLAIKLDLLEAAVLPKRAIQFGSRIARMENSKEKGSDVCERLKNK